MRKLLFSSFPFANFPGLFLLRLMAGGVMLTHGIPKLKKILIGDLQFADPLGLGPETSLYLVTFAEVLCSVLIIMGLFTRLALIPLIINMSVAFFLVHKADPFTHKEVPLLFLGIFLSLFLTGPGKFSLDNYMVEKS